MNDSYRSGSLTLTASVAMGTGVMIGAGIFALTGQVAELAGALYPLAFLLAAFVSAFSAYSYIKVTRRYPDAGGIAMILQRAYGRSATSGTFALLMALSMIINESLVARTFGTYALQPFGIDGDSILVPVLALALIGIVFLINLSGNATVSAVSTVTAIVKVGGILVFAGVAAWAGDFGFRPAEGGLGADTSLESFVAGVALAILAYKGFTTITNSGSELVDPNRNVGRSIMISLGVCLVVYLLVTWGVGATLSVEELVAARDYALAEASRPALGQAGVWFTVAIAIVATASGLLASTFAVSRMLAMLVDMRYLPDRDGLPGRTQQRTLVYTVTLAALTAAFFDLGRIASLGAIFYLVMDMAVHWGVFRHLREEVDAAAGVLLTAIALDAIALGAFVWMKGHSDPTILGVALVMMILTFLWQRWYVPRHPAHESEHAAAHAEGRTSSAAP